MAKPFFIPQKEVNLFDAFNEELIDEIVGQAVDIYKVDVDSSQTNLYGEADDIKAFEKGFRVNCLINWEDPETTIDEAGPDLDTSIEMYFHRTSLSGSNFYPEIGDIVDWNDYFFEINSIIEPQLIGGNPEYNHQVKAAAHRVRNSAFNFQRRIV